VLVTLLCPSFAFGQSEVNRTYRCEAKDAVSLQDNGVLRKDRVSESERKYFDGIIIDALTGAITLSDGSRMIWSIIQKGDSANDLVLIPENYLDSDPKKAAAGAATFFFRLRTWGERSQVIFTAFYLSTLVTGTCKIVR
jgi:hypothetical protein